MTLEVDKDDLINMIVGTSPSYDAMADPRVEAVGRYTGGFVDSWEWSRVDLNEKTEEELFLIYLLCKEIKDND